jgi:adenylate cyclase class 1
MTAPRNNAGMGRPVSEGSDSRVVKAEFVPRDSSSIEIDALELRAVRRRFMAINQDRLRRVRESLETRQQAFIQLLPLLFHINHPMLPGYLSNKTPCGISDYTPGKRCIQSARTLARSFSYQRRAQRRYSCRTMKLPPCVKNLTASRAGLNRSGWKYTFFSWTTYRFVSRNINSYRTKMPAARNIIFCSTNFIAPVC